MVNDSLNISAMTSEISAAVSFFSGVRSGVIGRIAVSKAVRHNEIYHVRSSIALPLDGSRFTGRNLIRILERRLTVLAEYEIICTRYGILEDVDINEQVIRAVRLMYFIDFHPVAALDSDIVLRNAFALYEKLERGSHPHPPRKRFYSAYLRRIRISNRIGNKSCVSGTRRKHYCRHNSNYSFHIQKYQLISKFQFHGEQSWAVTVTTSLSSTRLKTNVLSSHATTSKRPPFSPARSAGCSWRSFIRF